MLTVLIGTGILWCGGFVFVIILIINVVRSRSSSNRRVVDIEAGLQNPPIPPDIDPDSYQRQRYYLLDLIESSSPSPSCRQVGSIGETHQNSHVDPESSRRQLPNLHDRIDNSRFAFAAHSIWRSPMDSKSFPDLKTIAHAPPSSNQEFMQDCNTFLSSPEYAEEVRRTLPQVVAFQAGLSPPPPRAATQPPPQQQQYPYSDSSVATQAVAQPEQPHLFPGPPPGFHNAPPPPVEAGRGLFYPRSMAPQEDEYPSLDDLYEAYQHDEISLSHIRAFHQMKDRVQRQMHFSSTALCRFIGVYYRHFCTFLEERKHLPVAAEWEWLRVQQMMQQEVIQWTYCKFNVMMERPGQLQQHNRPVQVVQPMQQHHQQHHNDARPAHQVPLYMRRGQIRTRQQVQPGPWRDDPYAQPTFEQHLHYTAAQLNNYRAQARGEANQGGNAHYYGAQLDENDRRSSY